MFQRGGNSEYSIGVYGVCDTDTTEMYWCTLCFAIVWCYVSNLLLLLEEVAAKGRIFCYVRRRRYVIFFLKEVLSC